MDPRRGIQQFVAETQLEGIGVPTVRRSDINQRNDALYLRDAYSALERSAVSISM